MGQTRLKGVEIPSKQRIHDVEARDPLGRKIEYGEPALRTRRPPQHAEEDEDEDQAEPEIRQGSGKQAIAETDAPRRARQPTAGWTRRGKGDRHHNHQHDEHSGSDELKRRWGADEKILSNRARIDPGPAEVTLKKTLEVGDVLLRKRLVEAELGGKQVYPFLWGKRAQFQAGRIARQHAHESERDDRDQEQLRDQNQQASADVLERPHGS